MENKEIICSKCKSKDVRKAGLRRTLNRGLIQRYQCKDCRKRFVIDEGFFRMRNSPQKITLCLDLFYRGISTRKIQEHLQAFYPHNSSNVSIYSWIVKYARLIGKFTDKLKVKSGKEMQIDEMEIGSRKSKYNGFFIDCIGVDTRFMISSEFKKHRDLREVKQVLARAKTKTENQLKVITSDGWLAYPKAIKKVFGYNNKLGKFNVEHNQVNASQGEGFNIKIERLHNSVRQRTKVMQGFHGSINSANAIMRGYEIYLKFIREHLAIGCCPYELAIPNLKLGMNKWLDLINLSKANLTIK